MPDVYDDMSLIVYKYLFVNQHLVNCKYELSKFVHYSCLISLALPITLGM